MQRLWGFVVLLFLAGCTKPADVFVAPPPAPAATVAYTIPAGTHFSNNNSYQAVSLSALRFTVRFDSSAIYQTANPQNQADINKLCGFSDNGGHHHQYSARFGWRWSNGALRLFGYVYNAGVVVSEEVCAVPIGVPVACAIEVESKVYRFVCGDAVRLLPRHSTTAAAVGYKLYPYFGGDEAAPHDVRIWITED